MLPMWVYVVVALAIAVMAFGIARTWAWNGFYGFRLNPVGRLFSRPAPKV